MKVPDLGADREICETLNGGVDLVALHHAVVHFVGVPESIGPQVGFDGAGPSVLGVQ